MANQTGRPIAPARKLVAAVLGTIAIFVMVFGLGLSSWAIVALGAAMLALAVALGMVTVARRGARAWVAGYAQVKAISEPPTSTAAYGRAELQLVVVVSGLPTTEVLVRESRVPVAKWPLPGEQLPVMVDVDDMRRVRIDWDQAADRADDGDPPPPPPAYAPEDDFADDDLLGDVEPPPWQNRDREWGRGPDEPAPPGGVDPDDPRDTAVVVRETPAGPVLEGQFVDHADAPPPLPHRARAADAGAGRPPGSRPSPRPHRGAATATVEPESSARADPDLPSGAASSPATAAASSPAREPDDALRPDRDAEPAPADHEIDLPLDGDPEPPPEVTDPAARRSVDEGVMAPPPPTDDAPAGGREPDRRVFVMDASPAPTVADDPVGAPAAPGPATPAGPSAEPGPSAEQPAGSHAATPAPPADRETPARAPEDAAQTNGSHAAAVPEQRSGLGKAATAVAAAAAAAAAGLAATRRKAKDDDAATVPPQPSAAERDNPDATGGAPRQRGPWSDLDGGYEPDERTDEVITAYPSARPGPSGAIHGIGLTIAVTDLARSVAFYRDMLGFFEIDRGADNAILASGDTRLVLRSEPGHAPGAGPRLNLEVGDVEAMHDELQRKGVRFGEGPHPVTRGGRLELWAASFPDPDGNTVAITQWRALR